MRPSPRARRPDLRRAARLAIPALLVGAVAGAQVPPPRFPGDVDVVAVDVTVVDGDGRPVPDLAARDFEVRIDGRPRRVLSAEFIAAAGDDRPEAAATEVAAAPGGAPSAAVVGRTTTSRASRARSIAIIVDRGELTAGRAHAAAGAAGRFVASLPRQDRVAVFSIPSGPRLDFTTDRGAVLDALGKIGPSVDVPIADWMPQQPQLSMPLHQALDIHRQSAIASLTALEAVLQGLGAIEGPKTALLVSGGYLALDVPKHVRCRVGDSDCDDPSSPRFGISAQPVVLGELRAVASAAAASRTSLYPLFVDDPTRAMGAANRLGEQGQHIVGRTDYRRLPLDIVAESAGGALQELVGSGDRAMARLALELSGQYLLGLEPMDGDRDGKPHAITVKVARDGVTVRARRQFVAKPAAARPLPSATSAANAPEALSTPERPGATRSDHLRRIEDARRLASEGDRQLERESFEDAATAYAQAISLEPMYFMAHYGLGRARMAQKDYTAAIAAFEHARRVFEERTEIVRGRRAARDAERAARLAASQATQSRRGASGTSAGRGTTPDPVAEVDPGFSTVTAPIPELPPGLTLALGSAYFRSGRIADAEREYRAAVAAEPKLGEARINLAVVLLMTGRPADAREQIVMAKKAGAKVPAGLESDVESALTAAR